jgi:hypothetical protein
LKISEFINTDLIIGIAQIALGVFLSWKAFVVSVKDLPRKQRKKHLFTFGICSLMVFALSGLQTSRSIAFNKKLETLADKSDQAVMGVVSYNLEPLSGTLLAVDFQSKNKSLTGTAQDERHVAKIYVVDTAVEGKDGSDGSQMYGVPVSTEDSSFAALLREASEAPASGAEATFTPNEDNYSTTMGPPISQDLLQSITNGGKAVLVIIIYKWKDSVGDEYSAGCGWLQPNSFKANHGQVWRNCVRHNGMLTSEERAVMPHW